MQDAHAATAIILAGGKSSRLGRDKASEVLAGRPLLQHAIDRCAGLVQAYVIVTARDQALPPLQIPAPHRAVEDLYPETGPLGGLYTGLQAIETPYALALACDTPLLSPGLLAALLSHVSGYDVAAPSREGLPEPLCAVYARECAPAAQARLERGAYKLTALFEDLIALLLPEPEWSRFDPQGLSFLNINREADLARATALLTTPSSLQD